MGCLGASLDGLLNVANITIPSCCPIGSRNWLKGIVRGSTREERRGGVKGLQQTQLCICFGLLLG